MGVDRRRLKNHHRIRPKKTVGARRRRELVHRRRLLALGVSEEKIAKLNPKQVRDLLKYPAKLAVKVKAA